MPVMVPIWRITSEATLLTEYPDFSKEIVRGAKFLDEHVPDWLDKIDPRLLDLSDGGQCILGQTFAGHYEHGSRMLVKVKNKPEDESSRVAMRYGFEIETELDDNTPKQWRRVLKWADESADKVYSVLTEQWLDYIKARKRFEGKKA